MKKTDIKNKLMEFDNSKDKYLVKCVFPETYEEERYNVFNKICRKAKDFDDFINLYIENETFKFSQGAYEIYKKLYPEKLWYKLRSFLGDKCKKTCSDKASLKIGNDMFSMYIHNGYGDGTTRYAIFDYVPEWDNWFGYSFSAFEVKKDDSIFAYDYDCGNDKIEAIPRGKYFAKSYEGLILITKYDEVD